MRSIKLVYICGPYRAATAWEREQNVRRAEELARYVASLGGFPVCPHSNTRPYFEDLQDDAFWLAGTTELLRRCDALVTVAGWQKSAGSIAEVDEARRLGKPILLASQYARPGSTWLAEWDDPRPFGECVDTFVEFCGGPVGEVDQ